MGAVHDDGNNPRINFVPHVISSDVERGIPVVGKLVFDTRTVTYHYCTSTSPNSTEAGGGTWVELGSGGATFTNFSPYLQVGTGGSYIDCPDIDGWAWYTQLGDLVHYEGFISFTDVSPGSSGDQYLIELPVAPAMYAAAGANTSVTLGHLVYADDIDDTRSFVSAATIGDSSTNFRGWHLTYDLVGDVAYPPGLITWSFSYRAA